jgi:hypothetical protein
MLSRPRRHRGRGRRFRALNLVRSEECLGSFAGLCDLRAIVMGFRRLPGMRQGVSPFVFGIWILNMAFDRSPSGNTERPFFTEANPNTPKGSFSPRRSGQDAT